MLANADLITVETYVQQGEQFENQFLPKYKNIYIYWAIWEGHQGVFNDKTGPILLSSYPFTHIYVHVK